LKTFFHKFIDFAVNKNPRNMGIFATYIYIMVFLISQGWPGDKSLTVYHKYVKLFSVRIVLSDGN